MTLSEAEQQVWLSAAGLAKPIDHKKGQRVRTDHPEKTLPKGNEPHRIARQRGRRIGRPPGVANGWNRDDRDIEAAFAKATAKCDVNFYWSYGRWPSSDESWDLYIDNIPVKLWEDWIRMKKRRS